MKISKQAIMRASGWSETQYKREYSKFASKVKNLNRLAGTHYNVRNELYYSIIEPDNATVRAIREMSSARKGTTSSMRNVASDYVENRYRGLINSIPEVKEKFEQVGQKYVTSTGKLRKYSLRQFNAYMKRNLKKIEKNRRSDPFYNYEQQFQDNEMQSDADTTLYQMNEDEYFDIFA